MNINSLTVNHESPTILNFSILGLIKDPVSWSSSTFSAVTYPPIVYSYDASPSKRQLIREKSFLILSTFRMFFFLPK